jgi:hypothetical protein
MAQQTQTEEVVSKVKTTFRQIAKYFTAYVYTDFSDDDIPNVRAVNQLIDIAVGDTVFDPLALSIPSGSSVPFNITDLGDYQTGFKAYSAYIQNSSTVETTFQGIQIVRNWTTSGRTTLASIDITGPTNDGVITSDDLVVIIS